MTTRTVFLRLTRNTVLAYTSFFCVNGVSDIGITVNDSLTPCTHIAKITATAHQRVNLIVRSCTSRDISVAACIYYMLDPYLNITLLSGPLRLNVILLLD